MDAAAKMKQDISFEQLCRGEETVWINPHYLPYDMTKGVCELVVSDEDITDAERRLARFAPFFEKLFPETKEMHGLIESPLMEIPTMQKTLESAYDCEIPGRLLLKADSHLTIAGSVKARGGIYEVLKHAEDLALAHGMIAEGQSYELFASDEMRRFLGQYTVQVGSTGNLGMSIGIMGAALGFRVVVHMSAEAKQWKKDLLRSRGVEVREYEQDYSRAMSEGRKASMSDPMSYFVDDEHSVDLFLGYAVAARRLQTQLQERSILVDREHPLIVYLPAGVGSAPGGISYGLKRIYGDAVHCFFAEPTQCPSVQLGIATQQFEKVDVHSYGLSGRTEADGLACASPSGLVTRLLTNLLSGGFTVEDGRLYDFLRLLHTAEQIEIEPSSCAAFMGPVQLLHDERSAAYCQSHGLTVQTLTQATQITWATGGSMIPPEIRRRYLETHITPGR